ENVSKLDSLDNSALREMGRLPYPMLREKDAPGFRRISWNDAYGWIATKIRATSPRRLAFYITSRGVTNEVYYMAQKVARFLGTKVVLVNPYREPGMERYWVPSNFRSALFGTDIADYWFPVSIGGDIAFLYGVLKILIEQGWVDGEFIAKHTGGFEDLKSQIS